MGVNPSTYGGVLFGVETCLSKAFIGVWGTGLKLGYFLIRGCLGHPLSDPLLQTRILTDSSMSSLFSPSGGWDEAKI